MALKLQNKNLEDQVETISENNVALSEALEQKKTKLDDLITKLDSSEKEKEQMHRILVGAEKENICLGLRDLLREDLREEKFDNSDRSFSKTSTLLKTFNYTDSFLNFANRNRKLTFCSTPISKETPQLPSLRNELQEMNVDHQSEGPFCGRDPDNDKSHSRSKFSMWNYSFLSTTQISEKPDSFHHPQDEDSLQNAEDKGSIQNLGGGSLEIRKQQSSLQNLDEEGSLRNLEEEGSLEEPDPLNRCFVVPRLVRLVSCRTLLVLMALMLLFRPNSNTYSSPLFEILHRFFSNYVKYSPTPLPVY